jgi:hypothetical protein
VLRVFAVPPHAFPIVTGELDDEQIARFKSKLRRRESMEQKGRLFPTALNYHELALTIRWGLIRQCAAASSR